jgi:hypothetical protein
MILKFKSLLFGALLTFTTISSFAQPWVQLRDKAETDSFPKVALTFYDRNPERLSASAITVNAEGKSVDFKLEFVKDSVAKGNKNILVLIENGRGKMMAEQRETFIGIMNSAVQGFFKKGDVMYLADFHRMEPAGTTLRWVDTTGYKNAEDFQLALSVLGDFPGMGSINSSTDIHEALAEGVTFMAKRKKGLPTIVLLLSADYNYDGANRAEKSDVVAASLRADVPVYAVRLDRNSNRYSTATLIQETYGRHQVVDLRNLNGTAEKISEMMLDIPNRYFGNNYRIKFDTDLFPNGSSHEVIVELNGVEKFSFQYNVPSLISYIAKDPLLLALCILFLLALIAIVIVINKIRNKKRQREQEAMGQRLSQVQSDSNRALKEQDEMFRETLQQRDQKVKMAEERRRLEELINESKSRFSRLPRKPSFIDDQGRIYAMDRLMLVVGREKATANVLLDDASVSRFHANISYEQGPDGFSPDRENRFFIWDTGSTNGTYLNERMLPKPGAPGFGPVELKHNDVIRFGKVSLTFNY